MTMCGIAGLVGECGRLETVGERMAAALSHRGPDGRGIANLPNGRGVFAHARLKVIDLSDRAAQPFVSDDGRVLLTFNGEIYNFLELKQPLAARGVRFRSDSDTEVILRQYLEHGVQGLDALDGMFAFALYDSREDRLILMRDRFGKKPLYWGLTEEGAMIFASEAKALQASGRFRLEADRSRLLEYLAYGYVPTPRSFFLGVHKLEPASRLIRTGNRPPVVERYWSLENRVSRTEKWTVEDAKARVRSAVGRAVEKRLVADVPLGAFLSGGIDSSIVVLEMAARVSKVRSFSVGFSGDRTFDERPYARRVAEMFGTDHTELVVDPSPTGLLERLLHHHDEPYGDSSAIAVHAVAEATRQHVTVALTGDGGDEVFAGYTRFRGGLVAGALPSRVGKYVHEALRRAPEPRGYKNPLALLRRFVEHSDRSADEQLLAWNSYFAGRELLALVRRDFDPWSVFREQIALLEGARSAGHDRLDQILRHNLATYLLDDLLVKTDRMTMAVSLEARCPFLDTELVETAFSIPSSIKMRFGRLKWLLREAYRDQLPVEILDRKKHGFGVPMATWWSGELRGMVDEHLIAKGARAHDWLDPSRIRGLVDEHRSGRRDHTQRIFLLLQLELWLRSLPDTVRVAANA
jgi:asparagine synthase (glutamine-hydrolysing)